MSEEIKTFLIECRDLEWGDEVVITHDFSHQLAEAINYQNWFYDNKRYDLKFKQQIEDDMKKDLIPVGSLEFVFDYMSNVKNIDTEAISPVNIPSELNKKRYLKRKVEDKVTQSSITTGSRKFVKSATQYKGYTGIISNNSYVPEDQYLVSELIDIKSEFRIFIFDNEIEDIRNYRGDYFTLPDRDLIKEMMTEYNSAPLAYTMDVAVIEKDNKEKNNKEETVLIECHPFVSCGLYGFQDYKILPQMIIAGYQYFTSSTI